MRRRGLLVYVRSLLFFIGHSAGISEKAFKLKPVAVIKG